MVRRIARLDAGTVEAGGQTLPLIVRCDRRAKRLTLRVTEAGVQVTCPSKRHLRDAVALVESRREWITERLAERPQPKPFTIGAVLPVHGVPHEIVTAERQGAAARLEEGRIVTGGSGPASVARRVESLLRRTAADLFAAEAAGFARELGLKPCPVSVRQMRSRWGSCSSAPSLSFDWRLLFAPPEVARYVVAHEVAHRLEMNHSPAFWGVVRALMPDYAPEAAWLKKRGRELYAFGVQPPTSSISPANGSAVA